MPNELTELRNHILECLTSWTTMYLAVFTHVTLIPSTDPPSAAHSSVPELDRDCDASDNRSSDSVADLEVDGRC